MSDFAKAVGILNTAREKGIDIFLEEGRLRFRVPRGKNIDASFLERLKAHKDSLLHFLHHNPAGTEATVAGSILPARAQHSGHIPLSYSQERLWTLDRLKGSTEYHLFNSYQCEDEREAASIVFALNEMVNRHEVLRTVIKAENGIPYQVVLPRNSWQDRHYSVADVTAEMLAEKVEAAQRRPFDLAADHMLRATLFRIRDKGCLLIVVMHHIAADGWSEGILLQETGALYQAHRNGTVATLAPLPLQYADYAIWQRSYLTGEVLEKRLTYWKEQLAGVASQGALLPYTRSLAADNSGHAGEFETTPELTTALNALARQEGVTPFMLLLAACKVLLYKYSGQTDISVGTPAANRAQKETEPLIGFFINTLVLRSDLGGNPAFTSLLAQIKHTTLKAYEYQDVPFEKIVEQLAPERKGNVNPLFQVMFDLQNAPGAGALQQSNTAAAGETIRYGTEMTKFDLSVSISERNGRFRVKVKSHPGIFDISALTGFCRHYEELLLAIIQDPGSAIDRLRILTTADRDRILQVFNDTALPVPEHVTIPDLLHAQLTLTPDHIALVAGPETWTYARLHAMADQLALYLQTYRQIGIGDLVGIRLERDSWMIIALLGVLKAGAAYVPVDVDYPADRVKFILEDSCCKVVIDKELLQHFSEAALPAGATPVPAGCTPDEMAYVIYTSGSTGQPKGVMVEHRSVVNLITAQLQQFGINDSDNILQFSNIAFDASVEQILLALCSGARLTLVDKATRIDPELLAAFIHTQGVTHIHMVPAMLKTLPVRHYPTLRRVIAGGDSCPLTLAAVWGQSYAFYNEYGPTETTVTSTVYRYEKTTEDQPVLSIGRPLGNTVIYILDAGRQLVPPGVPGEIYIGGKGVARGYLHRPELTAQKFVADPFVPGARMYRTGDLGKWLPDGNLLFMGRNDEQVKIRGYRIELGEIEEVLRSHAAVRDAVVAVKDNAGVPARLAAFIIPEEDCDKTILREWLKTKLPDYMVPASITSLPAFPLNANGKVDRKALPDAAIPAPAAIVQEGPRTEAEQLLAGIWCALLKVPAVGIHDNFFELGGDSITSIQLVSRVNRYGYSLHPQDVFEGQTIARLAVKLQEQQLLQPVAEQGLLTGSVALLPIQRWFLERDYPQRSHFSQAQLFQLDKAIQLPWLVAVIQALARQHDALRLTYSRNEEGWYQYYGDRIPEVVVEDLTAVPAAAFSETVTAICNRYRRQLDIHTGCMIQAVYLQTPAYADANRFFLAIHHLAVDGVSWRILLQQFQDALITIADGGTIHLGTKSNSYREWADMLTRYATTDAVMSQLGYWETIVHAYTPLSLNNTNGATPLRTERDKLYHTVRLEKGLTTALLQEVNQAYHTTINDILLAALAATCCHLTGNEQVVVGMEGHGREYIDRGMDVSNTVGWFTTEYPLLLMATRDMDPASLVIGIKEQLRQVPQKGIGYGLLRYLHPDAAIRSRLAGGKWDMVFNYLGQVDNIIAGNSRIAQATEHKGENFDPSYPSTALMDISGIIRGGELILHWGYAGADHDPAVVANWADQYLHHLEHIIAHCRQVATPVATPSDYGLAPEIGYQELAAFLRRAEKAQGTIVDMYKLSPLQKGLLFHHQYDEHDKAYLEQMCVDFPEGLEVDSFIHAWNHIIKEHTILRSSFVGDVFEIPVQCVYSEATIPCTVISLLHLDAAAQQQELARIQQEDLARGMDFTRAPLMRITLIQLSAQAYKMIWTHHHIILDGWSNPVLLSGFMRAYAAFAAGNTPLLQPEDRYSDYIRYIGKSDPQRAQTFWKEYLFGLADKTQLPFTGADATARNRGGSRIAYQQLLLDSTQTGKIRQFCQELQITVNTFIQGVWSLLLSRYTGSADTVFGVVVAGRPADLEQVEQRVGLYINNLPLRSVIQQDQTVAAWLKAIQQGHTAAREHQYVALSDIQRWGGFSGDFYDTVLIFQNYPAYTEQEGPQLLKAGKKQLDERTNYLLTLMVSSHDELKFTLGYNSELLDEGYVERIKGHIGVVIAGLLSAPEANPAAIQVLTPQEEHQLLHDFRGPVATYDMEVTLTGMWREQVQKAPQQTALICEGREISCRELDERSDQLARYLQEQYGCDHTRMIGISLPGGEWLVTVILAVLKTGAGYVPMDTALPEDRIRFMLSDAGCHLLVNQDFVDAFAARQQDFQAGAPVIPTAISDTLAVIYTSGSTSIPKGVILSHRNMLNRLYWMWETYPFGLGETACLKTSISFVDHLWELLGALLKGVPLLVVPKQVMIDTDLFIRQLATWKVTRLVLVTSLLKEILAHSEAHTLSALQYWTCSGEVLPLKVVKDFYATYQERILFNIWGSTELTADATCYNLSEAPPGEAYAAALTGTIIGRPLTNYKLYILSETLSLLPVGVIGQICVAGAGVAGGYLNQPELTADRFVPNPFEPEGWLYLSGDMGRWLPDGCVEIIGRKDSQVKIQGNRVELAEVENILLQQRDLLLEAAADTREWKGQPILVAYVIPVGTLQKEALRERLEQVLPAYMIPACFVEVSMLPLTVSGKVNRRALPDVTEADILKKAYVQPRNVREQALATAWQGVLGLTEVSITDNFYALGGNSLRAMQVVARLKQEGWLLGIVQLLKNPQINDLAAYLQPLAAAPAVLQEDDMAAAPLSASQATYCNGNGYVHASGTFSLQLQPYDRQRWTAALQALLADMAVLRMRVHVSGKIIRQQPVAATDFIPDMTFLEKSAYSEDALNALLQEARATPFDLENARGMRIYVCEAGDTAMVYIMIHHVLTDDISNKLLCRQLEALYYQSETAPLNGLGNQVFTHALQQWLASREGLEQQQRWMDILATATAQAPVFRMPVTADAQVATHHLRIPAATYTQISRYCARAGVTVSSWMLAVTGCFQYLVYPQMSSWLMNIITDGREVPMAGFDAGPAVGQFSNIIPVCLSLEKNMTFSSFLQHTHQAHLTTRALQQVPGALLHDSFRQQQGTALQQYLAGLFNYRERTDRLLPATPPPADNSARREDYPLQLKCDVYQDGLLLNIRTAGDLFPDITLLQQLITRLSAPDFTDVPVSELLATISMASIF
ncbi:non-ribosomal peptide synthetase [Chitinophaga flava]|uniref:Carrier domain-containing protein n=1 Tax=Chitinophaga flava TaxID=2259036 RepID=A0A365XPB3_9BACT|nr:non-ribosomal peptide synthetase [Chitinophaga flava]RBL88157.1 hypothetical protein DF182_32060 [Chitinophaga flava]